MHRITFFSCLLWLTLSAAAYGDSTTLQDGMVILRSGETREWSSFPETIEKRQIEITFTAKANEAEYCLALRQQDVKQAWRILLNGEPLGELTRDENDMRRYFGIGPRRLVEGENRLTIAASGKAASDDVRIGEIVLHHRPLEEVLREGQLEVTVVDEKGTPLPCRLTLVDAAGALQTVAPPREKRLAVRPGVIYSAPQRVTLGVPAGKYTIYAGRGPEYSLAQEKVEVSAGGTQSVRLALRREVDTPGYAACDTHIHTLTYSGHGDATIHERMVTLAGEGIELAIAADHNLHVDFRPMAESLGLSPYFTSVVGNEVTTSIGHFNVFPCDPAEKPVDPQQPDWSRLFEAILQQKQTECIILNHGRDLHRGTRPLGPAWFLASVGENLNGWPVRFHAMEVINSGATQNDPLQLMHDWMALRNRGYRIAPIGASDSHDVARHFVGQGRTYIRCDDRDAGKIDAREALRSLRAGRVLVSYGLLADMTVEGKYQPGDLAEASGDEMTIEARILGPHWVAARRALLFANGQLIKEAQVEDDAATAGGVKWQGTWTLSRPRHDVQLVLVALGDGVAGLYWPTAKPYQPVSPVWEPYTLAVTGAIWVDADGDGRHASARDDAERIVAASGGDVAKLVAALADYDAAVAAQAIHLYRAAGGSLESEAWNSALKDAAPHVQTAATTYLRGWRDSQRARAELGLP